MNLLVIGADGFIGKSLVEWFTKNTNWFVSGVGRHNPIKPFDYVINCAGKIHSQIQELFNSNVLCALSYAESYLKLNPKVRYIHLGSSSEYGSMNGCFKETDVCCPDTDYAITKLLATRLLLNLKDQYPDSFLNIVRPFSVYGKHDNKEKFIPTLLEKVLNDKTLRLHQGSHDWIHSDDFCGLCKKVLESDIRYEIFNGGTGRCYTNLEVVGTLENLTNSKIKYTLISSPHRVYDRDQWQSDNLKVFNTLGWYPNISLAEGLHDLYINQ